MGIEVDSKKFDREPKLEKDDTDLLSIFEHIEAREKFLINRLRDFVEFPTVSSDPSRQNDFFSMANFMVKILKKFGIRSTMINVVQAEDHEESTEEVPLIFAETEIDPEKRTVLFYCHYDVNPINYHECWSDPFELRLTTNESELFGKGTSAAKGPLLSVINAIGAFKKLKIPLPVNVRILIDPFGTVDRDTTGKFLKTLVTDFFDKINGVCLCTGKWLGTVRPCVSHGSRGVCYFSVTVEGPSKDLHSGSYGGLFNEPIADLIYMLNGLVDKNGIIRITDIYQDVAPVTEEEKKYFKSVHFSVRDLQQEIGTERLQVNEDKAAILMRLWRQPSLTIHGIQGAFSDPGTKNVIPGQVIGKFSINIVPNMTPTVVKKRVVDYLSKVWKTRKSTNKIRIQMTVAKLYWLTEASDVNVIAAKGAVAKVYNTEPDLIREPQRVRMANVLKKLTHSHVVMIPIGRSNDVRDSDSEKLDVENYINGAKIFAAYMTYFAKLLPSVAIPTANCTCKLTGELDSCKCYLEYSPLLEEESYELLDESASPRASQEMSIDEKPDTRYYYLSMLALKRMQKLQEVISLSHLCHSSPLQPKTQELTRKDKTESGYRINSRAALESFSVADIHDLSKPRTGGWLPRPSAPNEETSSTPEITHQTEPVVAHVSGRKKGIVRKLGLFGMRTARDVRGEVVKKVIAGTAEVIAKRHVANRLDGGGASERATMKQIGSEPSVHGSRPQGAKEIPQNKEQLEHIRPLVALEPTVFSFGVARAFGRVGIRAIGAVRGEVMKKAIGVTAQIIAESYLEGMLDRDGASKPAPTKKTNPRPSVQMSRSKVSEQKRQNAGNKSTVLEARSNQGVNSNGDIQTLSSSSLRSRRARKSSPGDPISSLGIVSSLSRKLYEKRLRKRRTDSVKEVKSGIVHGASSESVHVVSAQCTTLSNQSVPPNTGILETNMDISAASTGALESSGMPGDSMMENSGNISTQASAQLGEISEDKMKAESYVKEE